MDKSKEKIDGLPSSAAGETRPRAAKDRWKLALKIVLGAIGLLGLAFLLLLVYIHQPYDPPKLLEESEADTVVLTWEFYACGGDCPYYRVLSVGKEENAKFDGQMAALRGVDVWIEHDRMRAKDPEKAADMFMAISNKDKFICTGRFRLYETPPPNFWQCCMDSANLIFQADECRQAPMTHEEKCFKANKIYENIYGRSLDSLPEEAEAGSAEAQYLLGDFYEYGAYCFPEDPALAEYWYTRAAEQGYDAARESLERLRAEGGQTGADDLKEQADDDS